MDGRVIVEREGSMCVGEMVMKRESLIGEEDDDGGVPNLIKSKSTLCQQPIFANYLHKS